jgi:hypothetical protein
MRISRQTEFQIEMPTIRMTSMREDVSVAGPREFRRVMVVGTVSMVIAAAATFRAISAADEATGAHVPKKHQFALITKAKPVRTHQSAQDNVQYGTLVALARSSAPADCRGSLQTVQLAELIGK